MRKVNKKIEELKAELREVEKSFSLSKADKSYLREKKREVIKQLKSKGVLII